MRHFKPLLLLISLLFLASTSVYSSEFKTIEWIDLLPPEDLEALLNAPAITHDTPEISWEDQIAGQVEQSLNNAADQRFQQALVSAKVVGEFNEQKIRIPGFIVPLEFDENNHVSEFFLVPYFGACIHVPPPPPNQIIYATYEKGLDLQDLYYPFWIEGTIYTKGEINSVAVSAYSMSVNNIELYEE